MPATIDKAQMAIRPRERVEDARRDFMEWMKPIERLYAEIHSMSMPRMILYPDGRTEFVMPEWAQEQLAKCDELAAQLRDGFPWADYGLEKPSIPLIDGRQT